VVAVGRRVLLQIRRDPRFIGLSLLVPCGIVVLLKLVLDAWPALDRVGVDAGENALPADAFVVHFVAYVFAAIALVRERTGGTLDRMLVASTARSEGQIFPFIPAVIVPSLLPSGLMIPSGELSWPLQALARLVPLTYAEDVLVPVFRDGEPVAERLGYLALLGGYAAALLAIASLTLRERE
jgi:ABC-2 type transport system permease protein